MPRGCYGIDSGFFHGRFLSLLRFLQHGEGALVFVFGFLSNDNALECVFVDYMF